MSIINRYKIIKLKHNDYLLLFTKDNRYQSSGIDKLLLKYINFKNDLSLLKKLHINFIVIENITILEKVNFEDNKYDIYCYRAAISEILRAITG